jgi:ESF2/ABP1 family protein
VHQAKLRVELSQSRAEQQEYLRNVELAKVLEKRVAKKREKGEEMQLEERAAKRPRDGGKRKSESSSQLGTVLGSLF